MRSLTLAAIGWLVAANVHAQITYWTDARSASGYAALDTNDFPGALSISYTGDDSQSATPSAPFADFNASLHGGAQADVMWGYGQRSYGAAFSAAQTSSVSPLQLYYSGSASAAQDDPFSGGGLTSSASQFSVSFSVSNSIAYALRCTPSGGPLGWTLSSSSQGVIISEDYPPSQDYSEHIYTGTFLPDQTYTLQANINVVSGFPGFNGIGSLEVVCVGNPPASVPGVWTLWASAVTPTNATLNGTVNPNGWPTTAWFQWGATTNYGNSTPVTDMGHGTNALALSAPLAGLTLGTTYHFRAAATNIAGVVYGSDQTLIDLPPPEVRTLSPTVVTTNSATLNGTVNPNGYSTVAWFQWGATTNYGNLTAAAGMGSGTNALALSAPVAGLTPGVMYHFRIAATNDYGLVYGSDQSFTTLAWPLGSAQTYTVLKNFTGSDGWQPEGGLVLLGSTLYGTASAGGSLDNGVVFKMNTNGSGYTVLKNFAGSDGSAPVADLLLSGNTLYGTTDMGGNYDGVVFKVNTDGSGYTVLKNFTLDDGFALWGGLVLSGNTLYGTASEGGRSGGNGGGVVFNVNTDGSGFAVLKAFMGGDGGDPYHGNLVLSGSTLYGTTVGGGSFSDGVVFKMNTDGSSYTVLKSFTGSDGMWPSAGLILAGSTLYGTTGAGGSSYNSNNEGYGVVFKMNTDGSGYTVLKNFTGSDGYFPMADLVLSGSTLYGTTEYGGSACNPPDDNGYGVVFMLNTDGSGYTVLKDFTGSDGGLPSARLALAGNTLYGTTQSGGSSYNATNAGYGVVFELSLPFPAIVSPTRSQTAEAGSTAQFTVSATGSPPPAYQWYFYGTNAIGCTNACLELTDVQFSQSGDYTVVISNVLGAVTSAPVMLNVIAAVERRPVPGVKVTGEAASVLNVDYADSLSPAPTWTPLGSVSLTGTPQYCFDLALPLPPQRLYRAWQTGMPGVMPSLDLHLVPAITLTGNIGGSVRLDYINQFGPIDAWVTLATVPLTNTSQLYFDISAPGQPARLYQVVQMP
jgi:uncharacterized repeat protein (TIGR03803 family)